MGQHGDHLHGRKLVLDESYFQVPAGNSAVQRTHALLIHVHVTDRHENDLRAVFRLNLLQRRSACIGRRHRLIDLKYHKIIRKPESLAQAEEQAVRLLSDTARQR